MAHPQIQGDPRGAPIGPVGRGGHYGAIFTATYDEGAAVGYKWFFERRERPLFPFGFGLSYTKFDLNGLAVNVSGDAVTATVTVRNAGARAGAATPQFYLSGPDGANIPLRLAGGPDSTSSPARTGRRPSRSIRACSPRSTRGRGGGASGQAPIN